MAFESQMDQGYPAEADIDSALSSWNIELPTENNPNFMAEFKQFVWGLLNALAPALPLSVYAASATTFNVRAGSYVFANTVKTYSPGSAVDPTDNDTTYVWLEPDNTIGYAVDGTGWPSTEHIKLAEVTVDSDGVIADITDLRAKTFLRYPAVTEYQPFVLKASLTAGSTVAIYSSDAPFKYRVLDAWSVARSADGGTWKITDGTDDITDTVSVTGTDKTIDRAGTIDDSKYEISAGGSLSVVGDGANADVEVYVMAMRVD